MNHAPAIFVAPALIYSMHRLLVVWIIVAHFHLCSLLDRYIVLQLWAVRRPMRVCCGSRWCVLFINIWDSLTSFAWCIIRPCIQYTAGAAIMAGACSYTGRCVVYMDPFWRVLLTPGTLRPDRFFQASPFFSVSSLLFWFGSVRQIKLATRQLLGSC